MENSLSVSLNQQVIFASNQHWLYPLFEFEDFLKKNPYDTSQLFLRDKIAGRAAASLIVHLGVTRCHIRLLSKRGAAVFDKHNISYTCDTLVEQINCRTENLITDDMAIDEAYLLLRKRVGRVKGLTVKLDNVSLHIEKRILLDNVSLNLERGEQLVIHGANGAGKTTLLRALLGLVPISQGVIEIGEYVVGNHQWRKNRSLVAYINQEGVKNGLPITGGEVVKIGLGNSPLPSSEREYLVEVAMRRTGSFHLYGQPYNTLSGGEKQRVSIARCLCQNAGVFLLDEPTTFLDPHGKEALLELLDEVSRKEAPTIIIVSHEYQWAERLNWEYKELKGGKLC